MRVGGRVGSHGVGLGGSWSGRKIESESGGVGIKIGVLRLVWGLTVQRSKVPT